MRNAHNKKKIPVKTPEAFYIVGLLKVCTRQKDLNKGLQLYTHIRERKYLEEDPYVASSLVSMYAKCGAIAKAQQVFDKLPIKDVVTWTALISGYTEQGQGKEALKCFDKMQHEGYNADVVTFTCTLKACGTVGALGKGESIHDNIASLGVLEKNVVLGSTLVDMYAKCGAVLKAQQVLQELPMKNVVTWNALIAGFVQQRHSEEALKCFDDMQNAGHSPDGVTFACALKACGNIGAFNKGERIHDRVMSLGILEKDIILGNALVDMYAKCGALIKAQQILEQLSNRNIITWTALIAGFVQHEQGEEALKCIDSLQHEGHFPNEVTFICALKACGGIRALSKGEQIHDMLLSLDMLKKNPLLGSMLVDTYAKCGALAKAEQVFDNLLVRDLVTWNVLIASYAQQGQGEEALRCFDMMQCEGHSPDAITFNCALKACEILGVVAKGGQIHGKIVSLGMLEKNILLGNTLLNMYAKCALLKKAIEVLKWLPVHGLESWNALIGGYAQQGQSVEAVSCLKSMQFEGIEPDSTTLVCLLSAYSNSGLLDQAEALFPRFSTKYGIIPDAQHLCCMVDLFGRAGNFNKALAVIELMSSDEYLILWLTLLGACHKWGHVKIGELAFERAFHVDKCDSASYICMANIYIAAGKQEYSEKIELSGLVNKAWRML